MRRAASNTASEPTDISYAYTTYGPATGSGSRSRRASTRPSTSRSQNTRPRTGVSSLGVAYQNMICAISESRGIAPTVGLAFVNLDTCQAIMCQITESQTYHRTIQKLSVRCPSVILVANTAVNPKSKLLTILGENAENLNAQLLQVDRKYWTEQSGIDYIHQLGPAGEIDSILMSVGENYYAVCCFAAVIKYVEVGLYRTIPHHTLRIKYEASEDSMMIDTATIKSLELIQNLRDSRSRDSLFGLLNKTQTPMGARLLRSSVLQPSTSADAITARHEAVNELSTKEDMFFSVQNALKNFQDTDRILTNLIITQKQQTLQTSEQSANNVIALKTNLLRIDAIFVALAGADSRLLCHFRRACTPSVVQPILRLINAVINEDTMWAKRPVDLRNQRTYAVRSGASGLLDVARRTFQEHLDDATAHMQDLATEHNLGLEIMFDNQRQHYFRLQVSELEHVRLPDVFVNVFPKKKYLECQTRELLKLNQKIRESHDEVVMLSDQTIQNLILAIHEHVPSMFNTSEAIAELDVVFAFATLVATFEYVRPQINETLAFRSARHPVKETIQEATFIPNDIYATQTRRFQIITGCNMSGKSTYIRSVALLVIMAQVGCFVPASFATFPIVHQLLARVSTDDMIEANVSTFSAEMREMAYILDNVDQQSLCLIDELGRGTSTRDGMAIALAISEALVSSRALIWFATHFRDLATIMAERAGVTSMHLKVHSTETSINMLYEIGNGIEPESRYGLKLAKVLPFPMGVLEVAEQVSTTLEEQAQQAKQASAAVVHARRRRLILGLNEQLRQAHHGNMNDAVLRDWLCQLQQEFVLQMDEIDEARRAAMNLDDDEGISQDSGISGNPHSSLALPAYVEEGSSCS